jgi:putative ABC transport system permease protein
MEPVLQIKMSEMMPMNILHDLRYALRYLRKSRGFTTVAVLTLGIGIGANTAVFSLINAVLLRPLAYEDPDRLVLVWESAPFFGLRDSPVAPANYVDWRARSRSFDDMGAMEERGYRLLGEGTPEVVPGSLVTAGLLRALRTRPLLGRIFRDDEDRPGAPKVALIGEGFWRRRFGADPGIVGKTIALGAEKHTIVGVLAAGTEPPGEYSGRLGEVWTPLGGTYKPAEMAARGRHNWMVIARLKPGVTLAQADAEMKTIGASLAREHPDTNEKVGAFVAPLRDHFVSSSRRVLVILVGSVAFVLLIACSNLANLLLSRAANRSKEVAVRAALGAGPWQLVRQSFCESLLLCAAGSAAGVLLASATFGFLAHLAPGDMAGLKALSLDWRVLAFTAAIAILTAVVFSLVPLLQVRRLDVSKSLKQSARTLAAASGSRRVRALLICSQVALAFVLLIGAALLIQTLARLRGVDPGFRTSDVLTLLVPPPETPRDHAHIVAFQREVLRRVEAIPGVASAGFTNHIPLSIKGDISGIGAEGRDAKQHFQCNFRMAGPGYLRTMGIPLRRGRDIQETDVHDAPLVVLINETLARTLWPGQDPIGRRLLFEPEVSAQVVGVVGDIHSSGLDVPPKPEFYISALQSPYTPFSLAIHTNVEPLSLAAAVRRAIWSVDPDQPIADVASMDQILDKEVFSRRVQTDLLAAFALVALLLAAVGLYGVLAYQVGTRIPEIGVRMALGAAPSDVLGSVVGQGVRLAAIGVVAGAAGALALSRLIAGFLFGVSSSDPATYAVVAFVLLGTAAVAGYIPARRAMRVDPVTVLRQE